jgi:hypothetical protein
MESKMTLSIKNPRPSPRARAFRIKRWPGDPAPVRPRPMHETKRRILRKLYARMKAEQGFVA